MRHSLVPIWTAILGLGGFIYVALDGFDLGASGPVKFRWICDPSHDLPMLQRKPRALRNGVPFQQCGLPTPMPV